MNAHVHHWVIDTPHGEPTVAARCKLCKASRAYQAAFIDKEYKTYFRPRVTETHVLPIRPGARLKQRSRGFVL